MKKFFRRQKTAHRLKKLLKSGWCPLCNSSPPQPNCAVCLGASNYGPYLPLQQKAAWAKRYIIVRDRGRG